MTKPISTNMWWRAGPPVLTATSQIWDLTTYGNYNIQDLCSLSVTHISHSIVSCYTNSFQIHSQTTKIIQQNVNLMTNREERFNQQRLPYSLEKETKHPFPLMFKGLFTHAAPLHQTQIICAKGVTVMVSHLRVRGVRVTLVADNQELQGFVSHCAASLFLVKVGWRLSSSAGDRLSPLLQNTLSSQSH